MRYSDLYIAGVATWLPPLRSADDAISEGLYDPAEQAANSYLSVPVAGAEDAPPVMAVRAARGALARSGVRPGDVALLLHASMWYQGIDFWSPAPYIHHAVLGENPSAPAIDVGQMSAGTLGATELAASYLAADPARPAALVTAADRFAGPGFDRWRTDVSSIVYGDGAAALVLTRAPAFARLVALRTVVDTCLEPMYRGDSAFGAVSAAPFGPVDNRARRNAYLKEVGRDHIVSRTTDGMIAAVRGVLDDSGLDLTDIGRFVFPNVGLSVLRNRYLEPLGLDLAATVWEWGRTTGHVGTADQITGLAYLIDQGWLRPGQRVMLVGIGAGFTWSCAIIECLQAPSWPADAA